MPETSQGPASGPAGHESAAMLLCNDMCHTAEKCPDPIILMPSHTAISRVLAVDSTDVVHSPRLRKQTYKGPGRLSLPTLSSGHWPMYNQVLESRFFRG